MKKQIRVRIGDRWYAVEVEDLGASPVRVLVDGEPVEVQTDQMPPQDASAPSADSPPRDAPAPSADPPPPTPNAEQVPAAPRRAATRTFNAPMPGIVVSVAVKEGDQIVTGDEVCVLEAMKMHQVLRAEWTGIVRAVHVQPGQQVSGGDPIVELE